MSESLNIKEFIKDTILPPLCSVCGKVDGSYLCPECDSGIDFIGFNICVNCGKPMFTSESLYNAQKATPDNVTCSLCKSEQFSFYRSRSFTEYRYNISHIIHKYKYRKLDYLAEIICRFLRDAYKAYYKDEKIDYLDTVPVFGSNVYDHMKVLAVKLSMMLNIPFADNLLKTRRTDRQQELDKTSRKINLRDAFKVKNCLKIKDKNIMLIDDVWTTGSTLNEISMILKKSNAGKIYLLTLARAVL